MYRFFFVGICVLGLALSAIPAYAIDLPGTNQLSINLSPENPRPYDTITITPSSNALNLSSQTIQILVNGAQIEKGTGTVSAQAILGAPGTATTIKIIATDAAGVTNSAQVTLHPADVSLIIEPNTTSHSFYEGGLLVAPQNPIRLVAITDFRSASGAQIPASSLIYTWKFGDQTLQSDSGIGRSVLSAIAPVKYRDANIDLIVQSPDSTQVAEAVVTISPVDPIVLLYQHDPLLGVLFNMAMGSSFTMPGTEATFRAISYYLGSTPSYSWSVNSAGSGSGTDLTVRSNGTGSGTAILGVTGVDAAGRAGSALLSVLFGNNSSSGIFGL